MNAHINPILQQFRRQIRKIQSIFLHAVHARGLPAWLGLGLRIISLLLSLLLFRELGNRHNTKIRP
eukprot:COSAG05_NODE_1894_length_3885_cov_34.300503_2_plen_66_part_00